MGHTAVVKLLIENGADINICEEVCFHLDYHTLFLQHCYSTFTCVYRPSGDGPFSVSIHHFVHTCVPVEIFQNVMWVQIINRTK